MKIIYNYVNNEFLYSKNIKINSVSSFRESSECCLKINSVPSIYFDSIFEYLMIGKTWMIKPPIFIVKLMIWANYFMVNELVSQWVIQIRQFLSDINVFQLYLIGVTYNINSLTDMWINYLAFWSKKSIELILQYTSFNSKVSK